MNLLEGPGTLHVNMVPKDNCPLRACLLAILYCARLQPDHPSEYRFWKNLTSLRDPLLPDLPQNTEAKKSSSSTSSTRNSQREES